MATLDFVSLNSAIEVADFLKTASTPVCADERSRPYWEDNTCWLDINAMTSVQWYSQQDLTITIETGITLEVLNARLAAQGQMWPFTDAPHTRLADFLATDGPGLEAGCIGFPRDWVLGSELVTGSGVISHSGGRVVKNVTGYDLSKLALGSYHTLGVLTAVTLQCLPLPEQISTALLTFDDLTDAFRFVDRLLRQPDNLFRCELFHASRLNNRLRRQSESWHVWFELRGDTVLLHTLTAIIGEFSASIIWQSPEERVACEKALTQWPAHSWVIEWGMPQAASLLFCRELLSVFGPLDKPYLQIRPAAGLLYTSWSDWPDDYNQRIRSLLGRMEAIGVSLRLLACPAGLDKANKRRAFLAWNLPQDESLLSWNRQLKQLYDPNGLLRHPLFPL